MTGRRVGVRQVSQSLLHLLAPQLLPLQQAARQRRAAVSTSAQGRRQRPGMCPSNPASSVSLAEDHRDPRAGTHPRSGGHSGFNPRAWTSKCAPHAPKGCWERCTQANTCSLETRAAAPHFWLTESSPNLLWASGRMNRAAHGQGCWQRTAQPKDWHHGHS